MTESIERSGRTVEEALHAALEELGLSRDEVVFKVLDEPARGVFGLGGRGARVLVTPRGPGAEKSAAVDKEAVEEARRVLEELLGMMGFGEGLCIEAGEEDGYIQLNATGPEMSLVIGRQGQTLEALHFIVNQIVSHNRHEKTRILVDVESYRARRRQAIKETALKMAERAVQTERDIILAPMTPFERRVVHTALADREDVTTFSEGEEPYRKVVIRPERRD